MISRICLFSGLLLSCFVFIACKQREKAVDVGVREQVLHIANGGEPQTLDPHLSSGVPENRILDNLFEGLVTIDPQSLKPVPGASESWEISEDGITYTFHLRKNLKWSNGDPITAQDFYYSLNRVLSPKLGTPYIQQFKGITNAIEYNAGGVTDFSKVGARVVDDYTFQILLDAPNPVLLYYMAYPIFFPVHRDTIERFGETDERGTGWTNAGNMVGNGPFFMKEWITNTHILLEPNPHYWDRQAVRLNQAYFYAIESFDTAYRAYQNGQVHVAPNLPQHVIAELEETRPPDYRSNLYFGTYHYIFNTRKPPLDDARVRLALAMTIDRETIVKKVAQGGEEPALSFVPPGANDYVPNYKIEENVEKARQLFAEAGYPNGEGFPVLSILYNTAENHRRIAESIHQMWKRSLGIDVELVNKEWKVYLDSKDEGDFEIARQGWVGGIDYASYLDLFSDNSGNNDSGWSNAEFEDLYLKSFSELDPQKRLQLIQQAEEIMLKEMPAAPIYHYTSNYLVDTRVKKWYDNSVDQRSLKDVYLEE
jgi:oligopeptide transport system substrate-binding protein